MVAGDDGVSSTERERGAGEGVREGKRARERERERERLRLRVRERERELKGGRGSYLKRRNDSRRPACTIAQVSTASYLMLNLCETHPSL